MSFFRRSSEKRQPKSVSSNEATTPAKKTEEKDVNNDSMSKFYESSSSFMKSDDPWQDPPVRSSAPSLGSASNNNNNNIKPRPVQRANQPPKVMPKSPIQPPKTPVSNKAFAAQPSRAVSGSKPEDFNKPKLSATNSSELNSFFEKTVDTSKAANADWEDRSRGGYSTMSKLKRSSRVKKMVPTSTLLNAVAQTGSNQPNEGDLKQARMRPIASSSHADMDRSKATPRRVIKVKKIGATPLDPQLSSFLQNNTPRVSSQDRETRSVFTSISKARKSGKRSDSLKVPESKEELIALLRSLEPRNQPKTPPPQQQQQQLQQQGRGGDRSMRNTTRSYSVEEDKDARNRQIRSTDHRPQRSKSKGPDMRQRSHSRGPDPKGRVSGRGGEILRGSSRSQTPNPPSAQRRSGSRGPEPQRRSKSRGPDPRGGIRTGNSHSFESSGSSDRTGGERIVYQASGIPSRSPVGARRSATVTNVGNGEPGRASRVTGNYRSKSTSPTRNMPSPRSRNASIMIGDEQEMKVMRRQHVDAEDEPKSILRKSKHGLKRAPDLTSSPMQNSPTRSTSMQSPRLDALRQQAVRRSDSSTVARGSTTVPSMRKQGSSRTLRTSRRSRTDEVRKDAVPVAETYDEDDIFSFYAWSSTKQDQDRIQQERKALKDSIRDTPLYKAYLRIEAVH